jgi:GTP-binding protein
MGDRRESESDAFIEAGRILFARPVNFLMGVANLEQLPQAFPAEVAFGGRSNVGKSSLINAIAGRHDLARESNTPGRTRELNYFIAGEGRFALVDMPGYGYAKAKKAEASRWQRLIRSYVRARPGLRRVFILIDARHGLKAPDRETMDLLDEAAVNYQAVLTKADKCSQAELVRVRDAVEQEMKRRPAAHPAIIVTSSRTGAGVAELRAELAKLAG